MATFTPAPSCVGEVEVLREQVRSIHRVLRMNLSGLAHADSLIQPQPGGNCMNWVVGHLVRTYNNDLLPHLGQEPVLAADPLKRYERSSAELRNPSEALPIDELLTAWDEVTNVIFHQQGRRISKSQHFEEVVWVPRGFAQSNDPRNIQLALRLRF